MHTDRYSDSYHKKFQTATPIFSIFPEGLKLAHNPMWSPQSSNLECLFSWASCLINSACSPWVKTNIAYCCDFMAHLTYLIRHVGPQQYIGQSNTLYCRPPQKTKSIHQTDHWKNPTKSMNDKLVLFPKYNKWPLFKIVNCPFCSWLIHSSWIMIN